jgi:hypothetical protein
MGIAQIAINFIVSMPLHAGLADLAIAGGGLNSRGMKTLHAPTRTATVVARLLERLDASRVPVDAHQYRIVAERLAGLMLDPDVDWQPLLAQSPAAATVYENLHYAEAGLCHAPLDQAVAAEVAAREAIEAARRKPEPGAAAPDAAAI